MSCAGLVGLAPLLLYNSSSFGDPLATGYSYWVSEAGGGSTFHPRHLLPNLEYYGRELFQVEEQFTTANLYGNGSYFGPAFALLLLGLLTRSRAALWAPAVRRCRASVRGRDPGLFLHRCASAVSGSGACRTSDRFRPGREAACAAAVETRGGSADPAARHSDCRESSSASPWRFSDGRRNQGASSCQACCSAIPLEVSR